MGVKVGGVVSKKYLQDLAERVFWTAIQGGLSVVTIEALDLPEWLIIPLATALAVVKGVAAKKVGNSQTASTLPEK